MKKLLTLVIAGGMLAFYACGPSKAELEAKRIADSTRVADSLGKIQAEADAKAKHIQDSTDAANAAAKVKADSARVADSLAAAKKGGSKPKPKDKPKDQPKVGSKRGG